MIVAGIGARTGAGAEELATVVRRAAALANREPALLAVPWFRNGAAAAGAARLLRLPVRVMGRTEMMDAEPRCRTTSDRARSAHGIASIAESCALAAGGAYAVLLLPRIALGGATCALAGTERGHAGR